MTQFNAKNERIKREYFIYLKEAKRSSGLTIDAIAKSLHRFEVFTHYRAFKHCKRQQAIAFKSYFSEQVSERLGEKLSKSTLDTTFSHLKAFFFWLPGQPGYRATLSYSDADFFNFSANDSRVARARREIRVPTLEQILTVLLAMPAATAVELRNRALIAFTALTGARDRAIASMKLKHLDMERQCVHQDARQVRTKFGKSFVTHFFPVGPQIIGIFSDYVTWLRGQAESSEDDPIFAKTLVVQGSDMQWEQAGLTRMHWSDAGPIRSIFKEAFEGAGIEYFNPHSFRNMLVQLMATRCTTVEEFMACSQSLGHTSIATTLFNYAAVNSQRQGELMRNLGRPKPSRPVSKKANALLEALTRELNPDLAETSLIVAPDPFC